MDRPEQTLLERLGHDGLVRVLNDVLDQERLVRLANSCGLEYPGMRTLSQTRKRVLSDLVRKAEQNKSALTAIHRALRKAAGPATRQWNALADTEKAERLSDETLLRTNGNLGLHLYLLAGADLGGSWSYENQFAIRELLRRTEDGAAEKRKPLKPSREESRLRKRLTELEKKLQHLEGQLKKSRETQKETKRDLIERKGELAESRMLVERLRQEVAQATAAHKASVTAKSTESAEQSLARLSRAVKRLATEQKKLGQQVERVAVPASTRVRLDPEALAPVAESLEGVRKDLGSLRRESKKASQEQAGRVEEIRTELGNVGDKRKRSKTTLSKGEGVRVGVFIDVQNMYYGARQLKGKLDFDALLQAAVLDRRLIQAAAYVVESKEIDQSGFIALLQQRGIEVRRKTVRVRADGSMKGDWDMELALDILDAAPDLDVVVLVSGDGDFTSLVKRVKRMGPRVEVIGFPRTTAKSLLGAADRFQPLDRKFMIYAKHNGARKSEPRAAKKVEASRAAPRGATKPG